MKSWEQAIRDGAVTGSFASIASTVALSVCGRREDDNASAPTNAVSHWVWGDKAIRSNGPSVRYTVSGYAIHHASSTLWGVVYEKWFGGHADRGTLGPALGGSALIAALACFVDYNLTPKRLRPGFEQRLSRPSLFLVYASFGASLALRALAAGRLRGTTGASRIRAATGQQASPGKTAPEGARSL